MRDVLLFTMAWLFGGMCFMSVYWPDYGFHWWEWKAWLSILVTLAPFFLMLWAIATEETHERV